LPILRDITGWSLTPSMPPLSWCHTRGGACEWVPSAYKRRSMWVASMASVTYKRRSMWVAPDAIQVFSRWHTRGGACG
jgi:hypothetical protein